ncbi:MAG: hypothetical protein Q7J07_03955 [Pelolinea sp.]|nr:hypothetical protein [Pelolinea sp.]
MTASNFKNLKHKISASLSCANPINIKHDFEKLEKSDIDVYHIDLCDGVFAPTFLLNSAVIKALRPLTKRRMDIHIYGHHPSYYLEELKMSGADSVIVQVETRGEDYIDTVHEIRKLDMVPGIGILPTSDVPGNMKDVLPLVSIVVANTVGPAYAGQTFSPKGLENMREIVDFAAELDLMIEIIADGGVSKETLPYLLESGANNFVLGTSSLFFDTQFKKNVSAFRDNINEIIISKQYGQLIKTE